MWDYLKGNSAFYTKHSYVQYWIFVPCLIVVAYFAIHCIQKYYTDPFYAYLLKLCNTYGTYFLTFGGWCVYLLENRIARALTLLGFYAAYVLYTNFQNCIQLPCVDYYPTLLEDHTWFTTTDWTWFLEYYCVGCSSKSLLVATAIKHLKYAAVVCAAIGAPALVYGTYYTIKEALTPAVQVKEEDEVRQEKGYGSIYIRVLVLPDDHKDSTVKRIKDNLAVIHKLSHLSVVVEVVGLERFEDNVEGGGGGLLFLGLNELRSGRLNKYSDMIAYSRTESRAEPRDTVIYMDGRTR